MDADPSNPRRLRNTLEVAIVTFCFTICFLLRCCLYLYKEFVPGSIDADIFIIFAHYVTEIIPSVLQLYLFEASKGISKRSAKFIEALYDEQVETGSSLLVN